MKSCRLCNTELPVTARFCSVCGSAQTTQAPSSEGEATDVSGGGASPPPTHTSRYDLIRTKAVALSTTVPSRPIPIRPTPERVTSTSRRKGRNAIQFDSFATPPNLTSQASAAGIPTSTSSPQTTRRTAEQKTRAQTTSSRCDTCGTELPVTAHFCKVCGSAQTSQASESQQSRDVSSRLKTGTHPPTVPSRPAAGRVTSSPASKRRNAFQPAPSPHPASSVAAALALSGQAGAPGVPTLATKPETLEPTAPSRSEPSELISNTPTTPLEVLWVTAQKTRRLPSAPAPSGSRVPRGGRGRDNEETAEPATGQPRVSLAPRILHAATYLLPLVALALWSISLRYVDIRQMNDLGTGLRFTTIDHRSSLPAERELLFDDRASSSPHIGRNPASRTAHLHALQCDDLCRGGGAFCHRVQTRGLHRVHHAHRHRGPVPGCLFQLAGVLYPERVRDGCRGLSLHPAVRCLGTGFLQCDLLRTALSDLYDHHLRQTPGVAGALVLLLANWVAQDYFSPQGLGFFFYLTIIAVLLKWFQVPSSAPPPLWTRWLRLPGRLAPVSQKLYAWVIAPNKTQATLRPWQRSALLFFLVVIFGFVVYSHPLTPFFVLASVAVLIFLRRCNPLWLPVLMGLLTVAWILGMAQTFLVGHSSLVVGAVGQVQGSIAENVGSRVSQGNAQHSFVAAMRVVTALVVWGLAALGAIRRQRQGHHDLTYLLLAVVPFPLIALQDYGGEMFLRIYLFVLPMMVFFMATLFYNPHPRRLALLGRPSAWVTAACAAMCILLLAGFLFTRYGNEHVDYKTYDEVDGISYLYRVAPPHSVLLQGWEDTPWEFQDFEKYALDSLNTAVPNSVVTGNVDAIIQYAQNQKHPTYLVFTRSEIVSSES